jgi:1-phosphofructokinase family hexose kinase
MILTVTLNPTLDRAVFVRNFRLGTLTRAEKEVLTPSGKGVDASLVLHELGHPTLATGLLAGHHGRLLVTLLDAIGVAHDFVWAEGETRHALVLVDQAVRAQSTISASTLHADERHLQALLRTMSRHLPSARFAILAGSLPAGCLADAYPRLIAHCRQAGVPTLLDTSGAALAAGIAETAPEIVKINLLELGELLGATGDDLVAIAGAAASLRERLSNQAVIVTLGVQGVVAATDSGLWHAQPPCVAVVNDAGAGDALAGCVAWSRAAGRDWPDALRLGAAAAAAVVMTAGTAQCDRAEVERLLPAVEVRQLPIVP